MAEQDDDKFQEKIEEIEEILKDIGMCTELNSIQCSAGSSKGDNYMSVIKRVVVEGVKENDEVFEKSLIVKRQVPNLSRRELYRCDVAFCHEIKAYQYVVPILNQHMEHTIFPECYYCGRDSEDEFIILEDLLDAGYVLRCRMSPLSVKDIAAVMKEIARMHATSIYVKLTDPRGFDEMREGLEEIVYCPEGRDFFKGILASAIRQALVSLRQSNTDGTLTEAISAIQEMAPDLFDKIQGYVLTKDDFLNVVSHGEVRTNNLMFRDISEEETQVKILDLQTMRYASPVFDIMHFVYTSTDRENPENSIESIIAAYCKFLHDHTDKIFGAEHADMAKLIKTKFSYETLLDQYKSFALYGLAIAMWLLPAITFDIDNIPDLDRIAENQTNPDEIKIDSSLTPLYHERLKQIVKEFLAAGYFALPSSTS